MTGNFWERDLDVVEHLLAETGLVFGFGSNEISTAGEVAEEEANRSSEIGGSPTDPVTAGDGEASVDPTPAYLPLEGAPTGGLQDGGAAGASIIMDAVPSFDPHASPDLTLEASPADTDARASARARADASATLRASAAVSPAGMPYDPLVNPEPVDDFGADQMTTSNLFINAGTVDGALESVGDTDWHLLRMPHGSTTVVKATFDEAGRHRLSLKDSEGRTVAYDDDTDGDGVYKLYHTPVYETKYLYVSVSGETTGAYHLTATGTQSIKEKGDIAADQSTTAWMNIGEVTRGDFSLGDNDWYAVHLERGSTYVFDYIQDQSTPYLNLVDSQGYSIRSRMPTDYNAYHFSANQLTVSVTDTYYLKVSDFRAGSYTILGREISHDDSFEDDHGMSPASATVMGVNETVTGELQYATDEDYFGVLLEKGRQYTFEVDPGTTGGVRFTLLDPVLGTTNTVYPLRMPNGAEVYSFGANETGKYFIKIDDGPRSGGEYAITTTDLGLVDDFADDATTEGRIDVGASLQGHLDMSHDEDWFAIDLRAGEMYRFTLEGRDTPLSTSLAVVNTDGEVVLDTKYTGQDDVAQTLFAAPQSGTYFLAVGTYGYSWDGTADNYTLSAAAV